VPNYPPGSMLTPSQKHSPAKTFLQWRDLFLVFLVLLFPKSPQPLPPLQGIATYLQVWCWNLHLRRHPRLPQARCGPRLQPPNSKPPNSEVAFYIGFLRTNPQPFYTIVKFLHTGQFTQQSRIPSHHQRQRRTYTAASPRT